MAYTAVTGPVQAAQPAAAAAKFSQPIANVVWQAGKPYSIIWTDGTPGQQPLKLMKGSASALQQVVEIAKVDGAAGKYDWAIPADLSPDSTYVIALGNPPDIGYTGQFTINAEGPTTAPGGLARHLVGPRD
ncbi:GPI anchored serine-threonine rich family protein [Streptomyces sp. NPDC059072]|uniref:GPI anchored serine-threonine rich family protein n=1 Tax=Streptomyces sp. NPDC059072 TaxID=3346715 RepID=UPI00369D8FE9